MARKPMGQQGFAWPLVLVMMAVTTLIVVPTVSWTSSSLLGARKEQARVIDRYSADAGVEHAAWRIQYESGFVGSLTPSTTYTQTYNSRSTSITVTAAATPTPPPNPPPCVNQSGGHLCITAIVSPATITPNVLTTFTYTLSIWNNGTSTVHFEEIGNLFPAGFSYVSGSVTCSGISGHSGPLVLGAPTITMVGGQQQVLWTFGSPAPTLSSGQTGVITFRATATPPPGTYQDTAWAEASPDSVGDVVSTWPGGPVVAGWPKYDISSAAGGATIKARVEARAKPAITSYQVQ